MSGQGVAAEEWNPDLYYRLKLKLWNRDRMTNAVRTPWDRTPPAGADVAHWKMGTRVVITEEGDVHSGKAGRLVDYRGKGWYAVLMEDGHKVTFSPLQWERTADQSVRPTPPRQAAAEAYRSAAHRALEAEEGKQSAARDGSPAHWSTPASGRGWGASGSLSARGSKGGSGDVEMTPSGSSQSNPPLGTRVRIIRTYGGQLLAKDEVRTGETHQFAHGWYYITLDDSGKKESCRRNSFVVVGDEEDIELGYYEGGADAARNSRKGAQDSSSALSGRDAGEAGGRNKDADEDADKEPVRTYTGKKRGRKPKERVEERESESDDEDSDDDDGRKKGKRSKESREEDEARVKREKEEARRRRERELEEREREKERERERQREEEAKAEANMTQEERDALEAARLAAMLNRNPRRRGGGDANSPAPGMLPRIPIKKKKEKKDDDGTKS